MMRIFSLLVLCATTGVAVGAGTLKSEAKVDAAANPIRRVVTMLQMMQKKVEEEGVKEEELYEKFVCYCKSGKGTLGKSIEEQSTKIPQVESDIKEAESAMAQLQEDLSAHKADRAAAKEAMAKATEIREKEAA